MNVSRINDPRDTNGQVQSRERNKLISEADT